jgi:hypothetical protein
MRLVIGGPARDIAPIGFAVDLAALYAQTVLSGQWASVTLGFEIATYVHCGREAVLAGALARQATHLLWLDTDMRFPPDTALRLASHARPIVAGNCVMRDPRLLFTAQRDGQRVETRPESTGLEAVDGLGLAVVLMETAAVAPLPRPWFQHGRTATGVDIGEDLMFCRALRAAGHTIYIDHDLSKDLGHVGQHTYRPAAAVSALALHG